jgi:mitochondrial fission protein ELM1
LHYLVGAGRTLCSKTFPFQKNESNLFVKAMGACGSKDAIPLEEPTSKEAPQPAQAAVQTKKAPEKAVAPPEETEENPGYESPAMVSYFPFRCCKFELS